MVRGWASGLKVPTLPVIALSVGVGVDYGIYLFERMQHEIEDKGQQSARGRSTKRCRQRGTAAVFTTRSRRRSGSAPGAFAAAGSSSRRHGRCHLQRLVNVSGAIFLAAGDGALAGRRRRRATTTGAGRPRYELVTTLAERAIAAVLATVRPRLTSGLLRSARSLRRSQPRLMVGRNLMRLALPSPRCWRGYPAAVARRSICWHIGRRRLRRRPRRAACVRAPTTAARAPAPKPRRMHGRITTAGSTRPRVGELPIGACR